MGAASGLLGTAGGVNGTGISGPETAGLEQPTLAADVTKAQKNTANSLKSQNQLLAALKNQNGLGQQSDLADQLSGANGVGTQNSAISGLQGTAGMYQNIANGSGPNPAQAALNQSTGQNVANQAAMMAGQRGANANVGLLARQAAQQGAATQQQAVGQGATLQAQQQVNALSGLANAQQAIGGLGTTQAAQQGALANQIAGQQIGQSNVNAQSNLANQQQMQQAVAALNSNRVSNQSGVNAANAGIAGGTMTGQQGLLNPAAGGGASAVGSYMAAAEGGEVIKMADGGMPEQAQPIYAPENPQLKEPSGQATAPIIDPIMNGVQSSFGQFLTNYGKNMTGQDPNKQINPVQQGFNDLVTGAIKMGQKWGDKPTGTSLAGPDMGGETMAAQGGLADSGGHVKAKSPSQKAVAGGDDYSNDRIPAKLSEGEIVLPRSVTMSKDPVNASAKFVAKVLAKRKVKK